MTNPHSARHKLVLTKNFLVTLGDEMDQTFIKIHDVHTLECKGCIDNPHDGEWGWDFELDSMPDHDILGSFEIFLAFRDETESIVKQFK